MNDPYASIADLYDLEHDTFSDDLDLYVNLAQAAGDPILELGCGSGRVMRPLLDAGFRVTGLDRSSHMLERALERCAVPDRALFHLGSMTQADQAPGGPFGLVIIALNGLLHLPAQDEQRETLASARRALDPRGQLILDVFNPSPQALSVFDRTFHHEGTWRDKTGERIDKFSAQQVLNANQIISSELWYDRTDSTGNVTRIATSHSLRYVHPFELTLLLELTGFVDWRLYGGYELEQFHSNSERLIVTAEVTATR